MTLQIFPSNLVGLAWDVKKTPINSTRVLTARSGIEYRANDWSYGKYKWMLNYTVLRQNRNALTELQTLVGFCLAAQGQYQSFLYDDPTDDSVTTQLLGTGNSSQVQFPLLRTFGGFTEPNLVANTIGAVYLNGTPTSDYVLAQVGSYGIDTIQFNSAPGSGVIISADFTYYFPVRFTQDEFEFNNFSYQFWEMKQIEFQSCK